MKPMNKLRMSRRAVLRGAGGIAIALPWLEAMGEPRPASAGTTTSAKRFVTIYTPGGAVINNGSGENRWRPQGSETDFELSPVLAPLEPVKDKLVVVDGMSMSSAVGEQHQAGIIAWLTGGEQAGGGTGYATGPSIDQVIAGRLAAGYVMPSVQMAIRWGTGKSVGRLHPINTVNFENNASFDPIPPRLDPQEIFTSFFGTLSGANQAEAVARVARRRSILDYVDSRFVSLSGRVSARDKVKLDEHLSKVRELEQALGTIIEEDDECRQPDHVDTSAYDPTTGLDSSDDGSVRDVNTDASIPVVGRFMMDMLVMALACDLTPVASLQWSDTEAKHTFPWLGLSEHHHYYQHDGGFRPQECEQIGIWYSEQHLYLLQAMNNVDMGGHSLLDESIVFFGSEIGDPPTHAKHDMPFLLAGGGGGLRGGRFLRNATLQNRAHNQLLVSILNLFGDERQSFGAEQYNSGPLAGIV